MPKDPFKPIQAKTSNPAKQGFVRRAPIENIMWAPKNPKQLAEALATIVSELPPKALSWFWRELTTPEVKGGTIKEQVVGAVDQHFTMFPGGSAAFSPYYDMNDEDWEEDGVFPPHMRDFRNLMIKRPDLPMTAKTDGTGTIRRLDRLPQTTAELTMIAYDYGASVPQQLVASLWNRAQTLLGDALMQPEWVWQPEPIGNFHEAEQKNSGHPLIGDGSIAEEPVSELGSTTANAGNFAAKGKITATGKVMAENRKQRVQRLFNRVFEEIAASKVFEEDYMPYGDEEDEDIDVFGSEGHGSVSEEDIDALIDASDMRRTQALLGTESTVQVVQTIGRILGKVAMLLGDAALQQVDELKKYAAKAYILQGVSEGLFSKSDAKEMLENLALVEELDSFRVFLNLGFLHPAYLRWRSDGKAAVRGVLEEAGVPEETIKKIEGRIDRAEVFAAEGVPDEALFKALGGEKISDSRKKLKLKELSKRAWRAIQETTSDNLKDASIERWEGLPKKKKSELFVRAFQEEGE
jgi:hypothetical protein